MMEEKFILVDGLDYKGMAVYISRHLEFLLSSQIKKYFSRTLSGEELLR